MIRLHYIYLLTHDPYNGRSHVGSCFHLLWLTLWPAWTHCVSCPWTHWVSPSCVSCLLGTVCPSPHTVHLLSQAFYLWPPTTLPCPAVQCSALYFRTTLLYCTKLNYTRLYKNIYYAALYCASFHFITVIAIDCWSGPSNLASLTRIVHTHSALGAGPAQITVIPHLTLSHHVTTQGIKGALNFD